mgnify:CR=1 FL=1
MDLNINDIVLLDLFSGIGGFSLGLEQAGFNIITHYFSEIDKHAIAIYKQQFKKSIYIKGRHSTKRLSYGVCTIVVNSRALKERLLKWLELYQHNLRSHAFTLEKDA